MGMQMRTVAGVVQRELSDLNCSNHRTQLSGHPLQNQPKLNSTLSLCSESLMCILSASSVSSILSPREAYLAVNDKTPGGEKVYEEK